MKKLLVLSMTALFLTSCGAVGYVSTPSEYVTAGKEVSVTKKNTNFFGFNPMDAQKVSKASLKELEGKCTNGVTNVTTTVSATAFILYFEKLEMTANCK
ncbi:MAG: hypothetical protein WA775_02495 [Psychroserpens sp.]|uniref:hypothetical protein n=1 Tax=Psychroserpens sp. TaxID=2020870 RepID=UPI003C73999E